jgi:succinyl-diaminopimelate desuccinylase
MDEKSSGMEALFVDSEKFPKFFNAMKQAFEEVTGKPAACKAVEGTTYAKAFPNFVGFGPVYSAEGEPILMHQVDERVSIEVILRNTAIYALTILNLAKALEK